MKINLLSKLSSRKLSRDNNKCILEKEYEGYANDRPINRLDWWGDRKS
ncbi:MAG: hypothetical protein ACTSO7_13740 [Candidatus Heimdallarchaeota archaeon]